MKIDKKNLLLGGIFAGLGALMLVLGIFAFKGSYFFLPLMGHLCELFSNGFMTAVFYLAPMLMFFVSIANIVIGTLMIFGIVKTNLVAKILGVVLAVLVLVFFILLLKYFETTHWAVVIMLILTVADAVWNFLAHKVVKEKE